MASENLAEIGRFWAQPYNLLGNPYIWMGFGAPSDFPTNEFTGKPP